MLKTKLAYMALGAVIASFGYFIGTLNNLNAEDEIARVKKLIVSDEIRVENEQGVCRISPELFMHVVRQCGAATISGGSVTLYSPDSDLSKIGEDDQIKRAFAAPNLMLQKPQGKHITLQIADKASMKLSNGGLKSKTIAIE